MCKTLPCLNLNTSVYTRESRRYDRDFPLRGTTRIEDEFTGIALRGMTRVQHFQLLRAPRKFHTKREQVSPYQLIPVAMSATLFTLSRYHLMARGERQIKR